MNIGMLWFDNSPKTTLDEKVKRAAEYYQKKYGRIPDVCLVHPSMMENKKSELSGISVKANRAITPGHLWVGTDADK